MKKMLLISAIVVSSLLFAGCNNTTHTATDSNNSITTTNNVIDDISTLDIGSILDDHQINYNNLGQYFKSYEISDSMFERIYGDDKSFKTYCTIPREDLRYLRLLYVGFDEKTHVGELMVNVDIADDMLDIFTELYKEKYQINSLRLVDDFGADDTESIIANNTSSFNFRETIPFSYRLSLHAAGLAIDINPLNNPCTWYEDDEFTWGDMPDGEKYLDRDAKDAKERHMINKNDLCYKLFIEKGFFWGANFDDMTDYQHFEKKTPRYSTYEDAYTDYLNKKNNE